MSYIIIVIIIIIIIIIIVIILVWHCGLNNVNFFARSTDEETVVGYLSQA